MKHKRKKSLLLAIFGLLAAGAIGFYNGYDIGSITNDQTRIKKELSQVTLDESITLKPVAKSKTGKTELRIFKAYLEEFQSCAGNLAYCNQTLKDLSDQNPSEISMFEAVDLQNQNVSNYKRLRLLTDEPGKFMSEKLTEYGASQYTSWIEEWCEDIKMVSECEKQTEGRLKDLYEENLAYIEKLD